MKAVNADDVLKILHKYGEYIFVTDEKRYSSMIDEIANLKALEKKTEWIPLKWEDDLKMVCDFPYELDGSWVIVTNEKLVSIERIKKDAYDHFYPNGRWFELPDVIAWMPLPNNIMRRRENEQRKTDTGI